MPCAHILGRVGRGVTWCGPGRGGGAQNWEIARRWWKFFAGLAQEAIWSRRFTNLRVERMRSMPRTMGRKSLQRFWPSPAMQAERPVVRQLDILVLAAHWGGSIIFNEKLFAQVVFAVPCQTLRRRILQVTLTPAGKRLVFI